MTKFMMKGIHKGVIYSQEVSEMAIHQRALNDHNGGMTEKDTANAMLWVSKVRRATEEKPVVIHDTKDNYLAVYAVEEESCH